MFSVPFKDCWWNRTFSIENSKECATRRKMVREKQGVQSAAKAQDLQSVAGLQLAAE
jgi:hypothetical protein